MVRVLFERGYGVYVNDERGGQHHRPHAHVVHRRTRIGSVYLETLEYFLVIEKIPRSLREAIAADQERLLATWEELNES
jgi:hypothetical protein